MRAAQNYRDRAQTAETASMKILEELTYGLPDKLTGIPGAYETISKILTQNAEQINSILLLSADKTSANMEVAANYEKLATAMSVMGDYATAAVAGAVPRLGSPIPKIETPKGCHRLSH